MGRPPSAVYVDYAVLCQGQDDRVGGNGAAVLVSDDAAVMDAVTGLGGNGRNGVCGVAGDRGDGPAAAVVAVFPLIGEAIAGSGNGSGEDLTLSDGSADRLLGDGHSCAGGLPVQSTCVVLIGYVGPGGVACGICHGGFHIAEGIGSNGRGASLEGDSLESVAILEGTLADGGDTGGNGDGG